MCSTCKGLSTPAQVAAYQARPPVRQPRGRRKIRRPAAAGSGVIAGRIEVGRGSYWGAGW